MTDFGPPERLPVSPYRRSPPAVQKIKRGGTGKISNSGNAPKRFHAANAGIRNLKKPGKKGSHHGGALLPKVPRGNPIWDPTDPVCVAYREAHPRIEAAWRTYRAPIMTGLDIETRDRALANV